MLVHSVGGAYAGGGGRSAFLRNFHFEVTLLSSQSVRSTRRSGRLVASMNLPAGMNLGDPPSV